MRALDDSRRIVMLDCARDRHLSCDKWWSPEYLCQCQCHSPRIADQLLDAIEADESVPLDVLWRIVNEGLAQEVLDASVTSVT